MGEKVFYTGASETLSNGDKLVHGQQGEVTGPATLETHKGKGVAVRFPGNKFNVNCPLTSVRRLRAAPAATPPRACAPHTRDAAHAPCVPTTASAAAPQPSLHAQPRAPQPTARVREGWWPRAWCGRAASVAAPGRAAAAPCPPYSLRLVAVRAQVSRGAPPPLPGGYTVGEKVFFTGASQTVSNGDKLVHGQQGEVTGPATLETHKGKGVAVRFPGNKFNVNCPLTSVRRLRAAPAATPPRACAPHTRDAAHAPCVPTTASAAAPQPSLHAQPRAPQPTARVREGWWPRAWCGRAASVAAQVWRVLSQHMHSEYRCSKYSQ